MKGTYFLKSLPAAAGPAREAALFQAVVDGFFVPFDWEPVESEHNGHRATLWVTADALRIGDATDSVRVSVTAETAQSIASHFGAFLPTTKVCDLVWKQAKVHVEPCLFAEPRSSTARMLDYHECVEKKVAGRAGLVENVGKHWVITNKLLSSPGKAANYGFFSAGAPHVTASGIRAWQPLGLAHNGAHVDYSQVLRLVGEKVLVDGKTMLFKDVATDPALCGLVSSEGILRTLRGSPQPIPARKPSPSGPPESVIVVTPERLRLIALPLKQGSSGTDVRVWQAFVGVGRDGSFGPVTGGATELFRQRAGLSKGRVVDEATIDAAIAQVQGEVVIGDAVYTEPDRAIPFLQARNYTKANRAKDAILWIVIHTMEAAEKGTTAEACAEYFRTTTRQASAHYCIDNDSTVQTVQLHDIAWCAPGANRDGVHLEHAGFAKQSPAEWDDEYSRSMLARSAKLSARLSKDCSIPVQFIDAAKLKAARELQDAGRPVPPELRGVTTHHEVSQAFKQSTHYDPGKGFPMERYLGMIREAL